MTLQNLCCSLEKAKRLDELGIKVESLYRHVSFVDYGNGQRLWSPKGWYLVRYDDPMFGRPRVEEEWVNAPMAGELGEILKEHCNDIEYGFCHGSVSWHFYIEKIDDYVYADTEADIRAEKLIHLKEQGII